MKAHWFLWSRRPNLRPPLPPRVDSVRLLDSAEGEHLAALAGLLEAVDQSISAMEALAILRASAPSTEIDRIIELALLRFAVLQFVGCFSQSPHDAKLSPKQAFGSRLGFYRHVRTFAADLASSGPRVVGGFETVVLVKESTDAAAALGVTTRRLQPFRLGPSELRPLIEFMHLGRQAYAAKAEELRAALATRARSMTSEELRALPAARLE